MPARFCPSDEQRRTVEAMVGYGIPQVDIARVVGINDDTLRKHFREEIDTGAARANARVAAFLFEQATGQRGDGSAAVFYEARLRREHARKSSFWSLVG